MKFITIRTNITFAKCVINEHQKIFICNNLSSNKKDEQHDKIKHHDELPNCFLNPYRNIIPFYILIN